MQQASRNNSKPASASKRSGEFLRDERGVMAWPRDRFRVLVVAEEASEQSHFRKLAALVDSLHDGLHCTSSWEEARARLADGSDDLCLVVQPAAVARGLDLLRDAYVQGWTVPIVMLTRSEAPSAERLAMSLGAAEWLVRARLTTAELERVVRNGVERAESTRLLREREERFRAAFDGSAEARLLVDDDGRCVDANAAARRAFSLPEGPLDGAEFASLLTPEAQLMFAPLWAARSTVQEQEVTLRLRDREGAAITCEVSVIARILPDCHLVAVRDVTEREELRGRLALSERMASLGTLAAGLAHEINNPLQVVYASLDHLRDALERAREGGLRPEDVPALESEVADARGASERVQRVVRDLSVFTRNSDEPAARVNLSSPLETSIRLTANTIRHRARLVRELRRAPAVMGNAAQLTQVFVNLLLNAAQAIPEGAASQHEVRVSLDRTDDGRVEVAVSDTGHGMTPDVMARVFDPFFTTRPVGEGTGLGLSVCHGIVSAMGGEILVESEPGRGTTFRVRLPVLGAPQRPSSLTPTPAPIPSASGRVLVVDDDAMVCKSLARLLTPRHRVVTHTSPREALACIEAGERFDAILCDVMMPEMSGIEVYQHLAERAPDQATRVIFVTGGAFSQEARGFLDAGQHRVLEKPVTQPVLLRAVAQVIAPEEARP